MDSNALVKEKSMHVFMIWDNCITCIALVYNLVHGDVLSSNACSTTLGLRLGILLVACLPESSPSECHTTKCINIEINQNGQNPAPVHVLSLLIMKPLSIPKFHAGFSPSTKRSNLDAENVKWPSLHTTSQSPHLFRKLSQFGKGSDLLPKSTLVKIITKKKDVSCGQAFIILGTVQTSRIPEILVLMAKRPWYTLYTPTNHEQYSFQVNLFFLLPPMNQQRRDTQVSHPKVKRKVPWKLHRITRHWVSFTLGWTEGPKGLRKKC